MQIPGPHTRSNESKPLGWAVRNLLKLQEYEAPGGGGRRKGNKRMCGSAF